MTLERVLLPLRCPGQISMTSRRSGCLESKYLLQNTSKVDANCNGIPLPGGHAAAHPEPNHRSRQGTHGSASQICVSTCSGTVSQAWSPTWTLMPERPCSPLTAPGPLAFCPAPPARAPASKSCTCTKLLNSLLSGNNSSQFTRYTGLMGSQARPCFSMAPSSTTEVRMGRARHTAVSQFKPLHPRLLAMDRYVMTRRPSPCLYMDTAVPQLRPVMGVRRQACAQCRQPLHWQTWHMGAICATYMDCPHGSMLGWSICVTTDKDPLNSTPQALISQVDDD